MDSDCPPPLDDFEEKIEFDKNLDDLEENTTDFDMELPTDYNYFSTAALDTNFGIAPPEIPEDFNNFVIRNESPPLDIMEKEINLEDTTRKKSDSPEHNNNDSDVAIEKEDISVGVIEVPVNVEHKVDVSEIKQLNTEDDELPLSSSNDNSFDDFHFIPPPLEDDKVSQEENSVKIDQFVQSDDIKVQNLEIKLEDFVESDDESKKDDLMNIPKRVVVLEDNESFEIPDDVPLDQSPIPSLNLDDDDDDDFRDFESAIPVNRPLETHNYIAPVATLDSPDEFKFEADFSNFNAFESSEDATTNSFNENFQGFSSNIGTEKVAEEKIEQKEQIEEFDDDDDDFGDFSDFTQAPAPVVQAPIAQFDHQSLLKTLKSTNLKEVMDMMFPQSQTDRQQSLDDEQHENVLTNDDFVKSLSDFDTTLALGYQYNNSSTSQSLVMALGIDARNIVSIIY